MKKIEVRAAIYAELGKSLEPAGFKLVKSEEAFVRRFDGGAHKIFVAMVDYQPQFLVSLAVGIRLDTVEDVFNLFSGADANGRRITLTSITQFEHFADGQRDLSVSTTDELKVAAELLVAIVTRRITPFLDQHRDPASVARDFNASGHGGFDGSMYISHAMHSLILAKLFEPERYSSLLSQHAQVIANHTPFDRQRFDALVQHLSTISG